MADITVREFFKALEPILPLYRGNDSMNPKKMLIEIVGSSSSKFNTHGEYKMDGRFSLYLLEREFENAFLGKKVDDEIKTVMALDLKIKNWIITESQKDEYRFLLRIEIDDRIEKQWY
jgi:hypothetical protein